jgi:ABC-type antimicrobial peptide transport system permease subunit
MSSVLLITLLYSFSTQERSTETGLLYALGYTRRMVLKILITEGLLLAVTGGIIGSILSVLYTNLVLAALKTVWMGAVGTANLNIYIEPDALITGFLSGLFIALLTMIFIIYRKSFSTPSQLQSGITSVISVPAKRRNRLGLILGSAALIGALTIISVTSPGRSREAAGAYFTAGFLLLFAGLSLTGYIFNRLRIQKDKILKSLNQLSIRNITRNHLRSLTLIGVLASSLFIIFTVGANRKGTESGISDRSSGTGGFAFFARTTIPVIKDLSSEDGRKLLGDTGQIGSGFRVLQFRLKEGDDASCLNLNRISRPKLLGVNPTTLYDRETFAFISRTAEVGQDNPWSELKNEYQSNVIPGIADETVIIWGLGKTVGDTITYIDEHGDLLKIKLIAGLVNSVFQGHVIISEENFMRHFPSVAGYRTFLIDCDPGERAGLADRLSWALQDYGLQLESTEERLASFNEVENTYLSIFLILGGLGLILGVFGLAVVIRRSVLERRSELALMRTMGFIHSQLLKLIITEHGLLLFAGILYGLTATFIAVLPALLSPETLVPVSVLLILVVVISASGILWIYFTTASLLKENMLPALRNE